MIYDWRVHYLQASLESEQPHRSTRAAQRTVNIQSCHLPYLPYTYILNIKTTGKIYK